MLYEERGVRLTYLIKQAATAAGLGQKICSVEEASTSATGRSMANDKRPLYWYQLYSVLENNSDYTVSLNQFPTVQVSMTGVETFNMCDRFWCGGSDFFGSPGVTKLSASPYLMWPHSNTWDFGGAWYPEPPSLGQWFISRFFFDQTMAVISKPKVLNLEAGDALLEAEITDDHGASVQSRGFCWNTVVDPLTSDAAVLSDGGKGRFQAKIADLEPGKTYYIRPFAINSTGTTYGPQITIQIPKP